MIKSCADCKTRCCKTGPGPYTKLSAQDYLEVFGETEGYNTRCENLSNSGKCRVWGTKDFPVECRIYVCQTRSYSAKEINAIKKITDEEVCISCRTPWVIDHGRNNYECENCGSEWNRSMIKKK
jgi:hypothetical protein